MPWWLFGSKKNTVESVEPCAFCGEEFSTEAERTSHERRCRKLDEAKKIFLDKMKPGMLVFVNSEIHFSDEISELTLYGIANDVMVACVIEGVELRQCDRDNVIFCLTVRCFTAINFDNQLVSEDDFLSDIEIELEPPEFVSVMDDLQKGDWGIEDDDTPEVRSLTPEELEAFHTLLLDLRSYADDLLNKHFHPTDSEREAPESPVT